MLTSKFLVRDVGKAASELADRRSSKVIKSHSFSKSKLIGKHPISSQLTILKPRSHDHEEDSIIQRLKEIIGDAPPDYQIVLYQEDSHSSRGFILFEGTAECNIDEAYTKIQATLDPLLCEGNLLLTKSLLKELILPVPVDPMQLTKKLVEVMENKPSSHSDWQTILRLLEKSSPSKKRKKANKVSFGVSEGIKTGLSTQLVPIPESLSHVKESNSTNKGNSSNIREFINELLKLEDAKTQTFQGYTPVMRAIKEGYVKSAFYTMIAGNDPNLRSEVTGETPLHVAVQSGSITFVKMLLAFDADPTLPNNHGKSPLDLAREKPNDKNCQEMEVVMTEFSKRQAESRKYFSANSQMPSKERASTDSEKLFILSLDGGGVRAFNISHAAVAIEKRMKQLDPASRRLKTYFDYIGGTSSGGIGSLILGYTEFDINEMRISIYKIMTEVFASPLSEREEKMSGFLKNLFGEEMVMRKPEGDSPQIVVTATLADRNPSDLHLMTSYGEARNCQQGPDERKVWEAGRITSAAPMYFPPFDKKFLDGGLMSNNPTLDLMSEVIAQGKKIGCVVSLGTGIAPVTPVENIGVFVPGFSHKSVAHVPKLILGFTSFFDHLVTQVTQSNGQEVERAKRFCQALECPYFRLTPVLPDNLDPGVTDIEVIIDMLYCTQIYLLENFSLIDNLAKCLLSK